MLISKRQVLLYDMYHYTLHLFQLMPLISSGVNPEAQKYLQEYLVNAGVTLT